jgi:hypothetical protein
MRWRLDAWRMLRLLPWKREVPSGIAVQDCSALPDVDAVATMRGPRTSAAMLSSHSRCLEGELISFAVDSLLRNEQPPE